MPADMIELISELMTGQSMLRFNSGLFRLTVFMITGEKGNKMNLPEKTYRTYVGILEQELVPAMGCTEPIAIAYCAAKARSILGALPERIEIWASGNIIKNVKSVIVPHTGGLRGMEAAAAAGAFCGEEDKGLEVIARVTQEQVDRLKEYMKGVRFGVYALESDHILDLKVAVRSGEHSAMVHIVDGHTNIADIEKDGQCIWVKPQDGPCSPSGEMAGKGGANECGRRAGCEMAAGPAEEAGAGGSMENTAEAYDYDLLQVETIFAFANEAKLSDVSGILQRQIDYNMAIAEEGMRNNYGARIGKVLMHQDKSVRQQAKAMAAAGSDARMSGCELPVIINSGSGNQGLTASLPVIVYAGYYEKSREELYRALLVSNLVTLHLKSGIGRLSAYCGAVSAGAGAGAGIAYLLTKDLKVVNHTVVNALAVTSGIVCDGAKASCAAKIAMAVEAGILGFEMYQEGNQFRGGDGLVCKGIENTIANICCLAHDGMKETDKKIIELMCEDSARR